MPFSTRWRRLVCSTTFPSSTRQMPKITSGDLADFGIAGHDGNLALGDDLPQGDVIDGAGEPGGLQEVLTQGPLGRLLLPLRSLDTKPSRTHRIDGGSLLQS
jgi:hypothetical protein